MGQTRKRASRLLAAIGALALVGAACGGGTPTTTPTPTATSAPAETSPAPQFESGNLLIWADLTRKPVLEPFAAEFEELNPGVTVEIQEVDFGQIRDQLIQAGPAGEGPDLIIGAHDWLGQLVAAGAVAPVDLPNAADFLPVAVQAFTYEGQLYGVPYAVENIALIRNTDLVPEAPASFEELTQIAMDLKADGTVEVPLAVQHAPTGDPYHFYPLYTALGGYVFGENADGTYNPEDLGLDSDGGLAAAEAFSQWFDDGVLSKSVDYNVMITSFGEGKAPFAITGPWAVAQESSETNPPGFKEAGVPYVVEPIPPVEGGTPRPFVGVQGFMVSAFSENPLIAQTFAVDFMATEEAQIALFEAGGRPPALASAFEQAASDPDIAGFGESGKDGDPLPAIPEMGSVWTAWSDAYVLIGNQKGDPQKAFENAAKQIRNLIAEGG